MGGPAEEEEEPQDKYILGSNMQMPVFSKCQLCGGLACYDVRLFIPDLCYGAIISCSQITEEA